jgi:hypothetical protein
MTQKEAIRNLYLGKVNKNAIRDQEKNECFYLRKHITNGEYIVEYCQIMAVGGVVSRENRVLLIKPNGDCYDCEKMFNNKVEDAKKYFSLVKDVDVKEYLNLK